MRNFKPLDEYEYKKVWDRFYKLFHFKPSVDYFPAITTDKPQLKFDISEGFSANYSSKKLEEIAIKIFKDITCPGERIYALDWQHESYDVDPREHMDTDENGEWIVPPFPNGDYFIFLTKDFNNVWFGHPWEETLTLIGDGIVTHAEATKIDFPISE